MSLFPEHLSDIPTTAEVKAAIPAECFERKLSKSIPYALFSVSLTIALAILAWQFIPLSWQWIPVWPPTPTSTERLPSGFG